MSTNKTKTGENVLVQILARLVLVENKQISFYKSVIDRKKIIFEFVKFHVII